MIPGSPPTSPNAKSIGSAAVPRTIILRRRVLPDADNTPARNRLAPNKNSAIDIGRINTVSERNTTALSIRKSTRSQNEPSAYGLGCSGDGCVPSDAEASSAAIAEIITTCTPAAQIIHRR
jgi:hypothetical protein